jgi:inorganic triphosphatase YgiF
MAKARPLTGLDPQAPTEENARLIIRERLADMYAYAPYVENPKNIQELHDLRIAAKRVRYTLEIFADFLPATSEDFAQELAALQDELGELHDSEVMLALLRRLLQQTQAAPGSSLENELFEQKQELLSSDMVEYLLFSARTSAPSAQEIRGLTSFLQRQEQRRVQAYASFHRHWKSLEQRHFREALLQILEQRGD